MAPWRKLVEKERCTPPPYILSPLFIYILSHSFWLLCLQLFHQSSFVPDFWLVTVMLRVGKGDLHWNHEVTVEVLPEKTLLVF